MRKFAPGRRPGPTAVPPEHLARLGRYVRARRHELGLSQGDLARALGYANMSRISNIETGREGIPLGRIYAWADVLQVPQQEFFELVAGRRKHEMPKPPPAEPARKLRPRTLEFLEAYERLPKSLRYLVRQQVKKYEALAAAKKRGSKG